MDVDALKQQLEQELASIKLYTDHPITKEVLAAVDSQAETLLSVIVDIPVTGVESFLNREQALGHLRGVRQLRAIIQQKVDEAKERLEEELGEQ